MVVFRDKHASIGRVKPVSHDKTIIPATSPSRSLRSLIPKKDEIIKIEILDNGYMLIDVEKVIGNRVRISKTNAKRLAEWIISVYKARKVSK